MAKNLEEYKIPVILEPYVTGNDNNGNKIEINILGRWLFGTPGYMGHIRVLTDPDSEFVIVEIPDDIEPVEKLIIESGKKLWLKFLYKYDLVTKEKIERRKKMKTNVEKAKELQKQIKRKIKKIKDIKGGHHEMF